MIRRVAILFNILSKRLVSRSGWNCIYTVRRNEQLSAAGLGFPSEKSADQCFDVYLRATHCRIISEEALKDKHGVGNGRTGFCSQSLRAVRRRQPLGFRLLHIVVFGTSSVQTVLLVCFVCEL